MSERPILFSGPMVRAQLAGLKTQTRRILKPKKQACLLSDEGTDDYVLDPGNREWLESYYPWRVGDRLWVRETHYVWSAGYKDGTGRRISYRATEPDAPTSWTAAIFMPRWASRLTLIVTDVRVQRLLDISEEDAEAEGFKAGRLDDGFGPQDIGGGFTVESPGTYASAAGMFQVTWAKLHPEWDGYSSPWVAALTFTVEQRNIDDQSV